MSSPLSLRSCLLYAATIIFITLAVCFSLLRAALPHAHGYVAELEATLGQQTGFVVNIDSIDAEMSWFTPRLILIGTRFSEQNDDADLLTLDRVELSLSYIDSIRFMSWRVAEINLVLAELRVERLADGSWKLQGFALNTEGDQSFPEDLRSVLENTNFVVTGKRVSITDRTGEIDSAVLQDVDISVSHFLGVHTVAARVPLPQEYGEVLTLSVQYSGPIESVATNDAEIYLSITQADLGRWIERMQLDLDVAISGRQDLELWLSMVGDSPVTVACSVMGDALRLSNGKGSSWSVDRLAAKFDWHKHGEGWSLKVRDFSYSREGVDWREPSDIDIDYTDEQLSLMADYIGFRDLRELANLLSVDTTDERVASLLSIAPATELYNLSANIDMADFTRSTFSFTASDLGYSHEGRQIEGLDFAVRFRGGEGVLSIVSRDAMLEMKDMFREPIAIDRLDATVRVAMIDSAWYISSQLVEFSNPHLEARNRIAMHWSETEGVFLDMMSRFENVDGSATYRYLPINALNDTLIEWLDTAITDGRVNDGYFRFYGNGKDYPFDNNGKLLSRFITQDLNLKFNSSWPALGQLNADVLFDNKSLSIKGLSASQFDASLQSLEARIDDLYDSVLVLDGVVRTPLKDIQRYIWASPLDRKLGTVMNQLHTDGQSLLSLSLRLPLDDIDSMKIDGRIDFDDSVIAYPNLRYTLNEVKGTLRFDDRSVVSENMSARLGRDKIDIDIDHDDDTEGSFTSIRFNGDITADSLLTRFDWMPEHWFMGRSPWDIRLKIPHYHSYYDVLVDVSSSLEGVAINFSDVVSKQPAQLYPIQITAKVDGGVIRMESELPDGQSVIGSRATDGNWLTTIDSTHLAGRIMFHESVSVDSTIELDLDHIDLGRLFDRSSGDAKADSLLPSTIPSLRIDARQVRWRNWAFDQAMINTARHAHGMLISDIKLNAKDLTVTGQGTWLTSWRLPHETSLTLTTSSSNFGNALAGMGYDRALKRGTQAAELVLQWPAQPYSFDWQQVTGSATVDMADGVVSDIDTGTGGKLVGLLNVFHLPRRLMFDFSDLKKDEFQFERIKSKLVFADGFASTTETDITASIANMRLTGDIDMHNQHYNLVVRVKPNQTAATFTGGAIAGGAVVGAGLVLLQKLLNIDKASHDRYSITGSWDAPKVTQIEKADIDAALDTPDDLDAYQE